MSEYVMVRRDDLADAIDNLDPKAPDWLTTKLRAALSQPEAQPVVPTVEQARKMGETGAAPTETERLLFEAWMDGHCWKVSGVWNGMTYVGTNENPSFIDGDTMRTRILWAAWRGRAALASPPVQAEQAAQQGTNENGQSLSTPPAVNASLLAICPVGNADSSTQQGEPSDEALAYIYERNGFDPELSWHRWSAERRFNWTETALVDRAVLALRPQPVEPSDEDGINSEWNACMFRDECRRNARAVLALKPAVPEGWRLVPVEPTQAMLDALYIGFKDEGYRAMLAAAPQHGDSDV